MTDPRDFERVAARLEGTCGVTVRRGVLLSENTTWRIGGPVALWIDIEAHGLAYQNVLEVVGILQSEDMPFTVLGGGSNILGSDQGYAGAVIKISNTQPFCRFLDQYVYVSADYLLSNLVRITAQHGWGDFEFLTGIPGTVGGALAMNAGTYDRWIETLVEDVTAVIYRDYDRFEQQVDAAGDGCDDRPRVIDLRGDALTWDYRNGSLRDRAIILGATFRMSHRDEPEHILARINERLAKRKAGQPLEYPSAGSVFRNPEGDKAWRLVDAIGFKGKSCGDAQISNMHTNFIVNKGKATAAEVLSLIEETQRIVFEEHGVRLQKEVRLLGQEA